VSRESIDRDGNGERHPSSGQAGARGHPRARAGFPYHGDAPTQEPTAGRVGGAVQCAAPLCNCPAGERCPAATEREWRARQQAGLAALLGIAAQASVGVSGAAGMPAPSTWLPEYPTDQVPAPGTGTDTSRTIGHGQRVLREFRARFSADHLVRNSMYLMLSSGIQAALGFTFWIVMARLFSTADVGTASSLVSATSLIAYFALFGLNSTLVRYLPTAKDRDALITSAFLLVLGTGAAIGLIYIILTPVLAPRLAFVAHNPALCLGFILLAAAAAVNLLTDSVFIASRKAALCALTDGVIGGSSKILLGVMLAGTGAYGLFSASVGGFATSAIASFVLIVMVLRWRPSLRRPIQTLKPVLKFSGANYAANAFNLLPSVVVPLIVLDRLGPQQSAYYFVAFQMASLLYAAIYAVESAFLAEGSQAATDWRVIRRRSRRIAVTLFVPGGLILALGSHWILLIFSLRYSQHGTTTLQLLAVTVLPMAACNWSWTVLRLSNRLTALVLSNAIYAITICGSAWFLAPHGLGVMASSWFIGSSLAACLAAIGAAGASPNAPRHRRTAGSRSAAAPAS
jgi:O-antigen/teichoic acid export membrane protein